MARKSRKIQTSETPAVVIQETRCGGYGRLSVRKGKKDESVEHQLIRINYYVKNYIKNGRLVKEYSDLGKSGTTFNRPGFNELLEDVKKGIINCIIVKDFSRFGRNYLEALELLDTVFPALNVRFISIDDNYDSANPRCSRDRMVYVVKHLANDYYAKVVSQKLTQAHEQNCGTGLFWGGKPRYGFKRSADNSQILEIEDETADIVRRIFHLFVFDGYSPRKIAKQLNMEEVPTPLQYYYSHYGKNVEMKKKSEKVIWRADTIIRILQDPAYIGYLVKRKNRKSLYQGIKYERIPPSERVVEKDALPQIIDKAVYDLAQEIAAELRTAMEGRFIENDNLEKPLRSKVFCGICGKHLHGMKFGTPQARYYCETHLLAPNKCNGVSINQDRLISIITVSLSRWIEFAGEASKKHSDDSFSEMLRKEYQEKENHMVIQIKQLELKSDKLYEDYCDQVLTKSEYLYMKNVYKDKLDLLQKKLEEMGDNERVLLDQYSKKRKWIALLLNSAGRSLDREMIERFISKIIVFGVDDIEIEFNFKNIFTNVEGESKKEVV